MVVRRRPALLEAAHSVSVCVGGAGAAGVQAVDDLTDEGVPISPKSQRSGIECLSSKAVSSHLLSRKVTFGCIVGGRRLRRQGDSSEATDYQEPPGAGEGLSLRGDWLMVAEAQAWTAERTAGPRPVHFTSVPSM